ncbi:unnamed protein product [Periconia digitata]|uniref:AB hydrolase-1 domain-containing protein n=1 Tax=Periconia digitata TaxID=1303443 RepID=A0A9W4U6U8_9PLEO|nr:unnamed protein product [Periconia digitata]
MSKPVFVFVPGAWNTPEYYNGVISILQKGDFHSRKVALPSVGCNPVTYDFAEDVQAIKATLDELVEEGSDVVLVLHSYSGQPGAEAVKGLAEKDRETEGLRGGVIRLIFIMAFMVSEGYQPAPRGSTEGMRDFMKCDLENNTVTVDQKDAKAVWFHDLPEKEAEYWASKTLPQSLGVFWSKSTYAGWRDIPSTYVVCTDDRSFGVPFAEYQINLAKKSDHCSLDNVETIDAGHFPMLSQTGKLVKVLERSVGDAA